jgi:hypothetical protein
MGTKFNSDPHPLAPWGRFLGFFKCFFENFRRNTVRVLKLQRGFILTKKEILTPQKIRRPPLAPGGAFLGFLIFVLKISKFVLGFRNFTGVLLSQKKEILTPEKIKGPPPGPLGGNF